MDYRNDAKLFKALSDENRLQILAQLNNEEKCACVLLEKLAISQPTLSHHMRILAEARLVECRKEGKWMYYSLRRGAEEEMAGLIKAYLTSKDD
ncbi:ArsR/SmtB family transcription factor [Anaerovibrio slackiae]|uniref:ArsR/SmtB family transcription factor n=1 Tax=Anaerovibrio slackiae TaxID=2652309 RepID=UPI00386BC248